MIRESIEFYLAQDRLGHEHTVQYALLVLGYISRGCMVAASQHNKGITRVKLNKYRLTLIRLFQTVLQMRAGNKPGSAILLGSASVGNERGDDYITAYSIFLWGNGQLLCMVIHIIPVQPLRLVSRKSRKRHRRAIDRGRLEYAVSIAHPSFMARGEKLIANVWMELVTERFLHERKRLPRQRTYYSGLIGEKLVLPALVEVGFDVVSHFL